MLIDCRAANSRGMFANVELTRMHNMLYAADEENSGKALLEFTCALSKTTTLFCFSVLFVFNQSLWLGMLHYEEFFASCFRTPAFWVPVVVTRLLWNHLEQ